jgi:ligand-binding SRPBCC domain-containing protein
MGLAHFLQSELRVDRPLGEVFAFFSDPQNLARLTPPDVGFALVPPLPGPLGEGTVINYRIRLAGLPLRWQSLISQWDPPNRFADEQTRGPYARWLHVHRFDADGSGTWVRDDVFYRLPFAPLGEVAHPFVRRKLESIFAYRRDALARHFGHGTRAEAVPVVS